LGGNAAVGWGHMTKPLCEVCVLEVEVRCLKHLVADLSLDKHMLQEVLAAV